jgi:hypothetical protein
MFWDAYHQTRIASAERLSDVPDSKVDRTARTVEDLQRHVDRLSLACQAMWELLRECSDLKEDDLERKIMEVDGRDGSLDGKMGVQQLNCPACGRKTNSKRNTCIFCGAPTKRPHQFDG